LRCPRSGWQAHLIALSEQRNREAVHNVIKGAAGMFHARFGDLSLL
jgi:hypothetical protein